MKTHEEYMNLTTMSYDLYPRPRSMDEAPKPLQRARRHIFRGGKAHTHSTHQLPEDFLYTKLKDD
jgi:hypothetical protein